MNGIPTSLSLSFSAADQVWVVPLAAQIQATALLGDVDVGMDIWHCAGCGRIWNSAYSWGEAAFIGTGAVVAGVPAAGELLGSLSTLPQMQIAVGAGSPFHTAYGVNDVWLNATGDFLNMTITDGASYARYVQMYGGLQFSVPVLYSEAVVGTAGATASTCLTGACSAFLKGWGIF
jgi:hypothetical protein